MQCTTRNTSTSDIGSVRIALVRDVELRNLPPGGSYSHSKKASKARASSSHDKRSKKISKTIKENGFSGVLAGQEAHFELFLKVETLKKPFYSTVESHFLTIGYRVIVDCSVLGTMSLSDAKIEFPVTTDLKIVPPKVFPAWRLDAGGDVAVESARLDSELLAIPE